METRIKEAKSPQHFETIISEIAATVYGDQADQEVKNIYLDLLDQFTIAVEEAKELAQRAQAGDPDAIKLIEKVQQTEDFKEVMNKFSE
jgi:hypothetical protein